MKKRLVMFFVVLALAACFFALTVNADSIYSDYTKPGANGEAPIFTFGGYSVREESGGICVRYDVNVEALKAYEEKTGVTLEYGVVIANKAYVENGKPLDENGMPTGANKDKILVVEPEKMLDSVQKRADRIEISVVGISMLNFEKHLIMSLFVKGDEASVRYIDEDATNDAPQSITFNDAVAGKPATPAIPPITEVKIGSIVYAIDGVTAPADDRIKQMNASAADYKKGSSESTWLYSIAASTIAFGGSTLGMPDAAKFMSHYTGNTGKDYTIDVASMLSGDSGALSCRNTAINNALRAAEQLAQRGKSINVGQLTEGHPMQWQLATQNWQYSLGSYFDDVDVNNLTVTEVNGVKTYTADITYIVTDFYNWDTNDYNKFKDIISPHQLHELHKAGKAKEFLSYGEITYSSITWTAGQEVSDIAGLN